MPFPITHILINIIIVDLIRDHFIKHRRAWPNKYIFAAGVGGIISDLDIAFGYIMYFLFGTGVMAYHKGFTHSLAFLLIFLVITALLYSTGKKNLYKYFLMFSVGIGIHLLLDLTGVIPLFWGLSSAQIGLNLVPGAVTIAGFDGLLFLLWLWHEEKHHKISDFL